MMAMTQTTPTSRRSPLSVAITAGWLAWCLFIFSTVIATSAALLERYSGVCAGEGSTVRNWAFELFPFAQVCVQSGTTFVLTIGAVTQTAVIYLSLLVSIAATAVILTRRRFRDLPRTAVFLLVAQAAGVVLAGFTFLIRQITDSAPPPLIGADLGRIWSIAVALGVGTALMVFIIAAITLVRLGRTSG